MSFDPRTLTENAAPRLRRYAEARRWYDGQHWPQSARKTQRQLTFNYVRLAVQKGVSYTLTGQQSVCDPTGTTDTDRESARAVERAIAAARHAAGFEFQALRTETAAAVYGDGAFKLTFDPDTRRIQMSSPSPASLFPKFRWDDPSQLEAMYQQYTMTPAEVRKTYNIRRPGPGPITITEHWTADKLRIHLNNSEPLELPNAYGFVPFVWLPNTPSLDSPFGESDVDQLRPINEELNREFSQISRILELSGNPIAVIEGVNSAQNIAVQPGAIWDLPTDSKAYLLDLLRDGGARLHLEMIDRLRTALHDISELPPAAFGEGGDRPSGAALAMELDPLTKRVERKRAIRSGVYERLDALTLRLHAQYLDAALEILPTRTIWGPVLPTDRTGQVMEEMQLVAAGIHSRRHAASVTGVVDPDLEFAQLLEEEQSLQAIRTTAPAPGGPV